MPTGQPHVFRCTKCKAKSMGDDRGTYWAPTGKVRVLAKYGFRFDVRQAEYRCRVCGHVGWSSHPDVLYHRIRGWIEP